MLKLIHIERKRILNLKVFLLFLGIIAAVSAGSAYTSAKRYQIPGEDGTALTWRENLAESREIGEGRSISPECLKALRERGTGFANACEENLTEIVKMNYGTFPDYLSDEDCSRFYTRRLENIRESLEGNTQMNYTQKEINKVMERAREISEIKVSYAEGWSWVNRDAGGFMSVLLIVIAVILLPLIGVDARTNMEELCHSTRNGKVHLNHARIVAAFLMGGALYFTGIALYLVIKLLPFGCAGWNQGIQGNWITFFSTYPITNLQQFFINAALGFVAMLFTVSLVVLLSVLMKGIMQSAIVFAFFWILLALFEQMSLWAINYYFGNFMPLRLAGNISFYTSNEVYRFAGASFDSLFACPAVSLMITLAMTGLAFVRQQLFHNLNK